MSRMVFGTPAGYNNPPGGISKSKSEATFRFTRPGPRGRRGGGGDRNATEVAETEIHCALPLCPIAPSARLPVPLVLSSSTLVASVGALVAPDQQHNRVTHVVLDRLDRWAPNLRRKAPPFARIASSREGTRTRCDGAHACPPYERDSGWHREPLPRAKATPTISKQSSTVCWRRGCDRRGTRSWRWSPGKHAMARSR